MSDTFRVFDGSTVILTNNFINQKILEDYQCAKGICRLVFKGGSILTVAAPCGCKLKYEFQGRKIIDVNLELEQFLNHRCILYTSIDKVFIDIMDDIEILTRFCIIVELDEEYICDKCICDRQYVDEEHLAMGFYTVKLSSRGNDHKLHLIASDECYKYDIDLGAIQTKTIPFMYEKNGVAETPAGIIQVRILCDKNQYKSPPIRSKVTGNILEFFSEMNELVFALEFYMEYSKNIITLLSGFFHTHEDYMLEHASQDVAQDVAQTTNSFKKFFKLRR